jgi:hypothetical protein
MSEWTPGEWLFNAIAHETYEGDNVTARKGRYRLFGSSNNLAKVMRLTTDSDDSIETLDVTLQGLNPRDNDDSVCSSRLWTNPNKRINNPLLNNSSSISTSEMVARWKLKNNIPESEAEVMFKMKQEAWRKWKLRDSKQSRQESIWGPAGPPVLT